MRTTTTTLLILIVLGAIQAHAGSVTYHSDMGTAYGVSHDRFFNELDFSNQPAGLSLSYSYDASIRSVNGAFTIPDLTIKVSVPGYFLCIAQTNFFAPGTITWIGDTISFHAAYSVFGPNAYPPNDVVDVSFAAGGLTPGMLPSSLADLEGITGTFSAQVNPSIGSPEPLGFAVGSVVSLPEPESLVLLAIGMAGVITISRWGNARLCPTASPQGGTST